MSDLVNRAIRLATEAHQRIDHRRKYSKQPYSVHLEKVAKIVASVTDDEQMVAAAWLHDAVEDTPATLDDIEREFGPAVTLLVRELTDISKPGDGNRAVRKAIDREHLARASGRAQTIKLADLIDNAQDIAAHDERFAQVYLNEMEALLAVLTEADEGLMRRARNALATHSQRTLHALERSRRIWKVRILAAPRTSPSDHTSSGSTTIYSPPRTSRSLCFPSMPKRPLRK